MADAFQLPVLTASEPDAAALGAALQVRENGIPDYPFFSSLGHQTLGLHQSTSHGLFESSARSLSDDAQKPLREA